MPGAFAESLDMRAARGVKLLFQHDPNEPIGVWLELTEDDKGLLDRGRLMPEVTRAREALSLMRAGAHACRTRAQPRARHAELVVSARFLAAGWLHHAAGPACAGGGSVKLHDAAGGSATLDVNAYDVDALSEPARIVLKGALPASVPRALNAYEVSFTGGYNTSQRTCLSRYARRFSCSSPIGSSGASRSSSAPHRRRCRRRSPVCCCPIAGSGYDGVLPSALRHHVTLEELAREPDEGGGFDETWEQVAELAADIRPDEGSEAVEADRLSGTVTHQIALRYRPGVVPTMRFRKAARVFHILGVINSSGSNVSARSASCDERQSQGDSPRSRIGSPARLTSGP